jgi:hypothetical protein
MVYGLWSMVYSMVFDAYGPPYSLGDCVGCALDLESMVYGLWTSSPPQPPSPSRVHRNGAPLGAAVPLGEKLLRGEVIGLLLLPPSAVGAASRTSWSRARPSGSTPRPSDSPAKGRYNRYSDETTLDLVFFSPFEDLFSKIYIELHVSKVS